jgi:glutamate racemase
MGIDLFAGTVYAARVMSGRPPKVLIFDSGVGGLSVLREVRRALPAAHLVYVADDAGFPYGALSEVDLVERVTRLMTGLVAVHTPDAVVIACNTASTLVLPGLRAALPVPVIGTVPAIKPAAERTTSGLISVLATPGTVARDYTRALIDAHARGAQVTLVGSSRLAGLAEARLRGQAIDASAVEREIAPCFVRRDGLRTDVVVLACTHYPFLTDLFGRLAPWPVAWIDPAAAIARRVHTVLYGEEAHERFDEDEDDEADGATAAQAAAVPGRAVFTSGRPPEPALVAALTRHGLLCSAD